MCDTTSCLAFWERWSSKLWCYRMILLWHYFTYPFIRPFIHSPVCLTTDPQPLPKPVPHTVRSSSSSFNFQYPLFPLRPSNSCLPLHPRLPVTFSFFPSTNYFRMQFLRKLWPIQFFLLLLTVCTISLSPLTLCNTFSFLTRSVQLIISILLQHHISELSKYF